MRLGLRVEFTDAELIHDGDAIEFYVDAVIALTNRERDSHITRADVTVEHHRDVARGTVEVELMCDVVDDG